MTNPEAFRYFKKHPNRSGPVERWLTDLGIDDTFDVDFRAGILATLAVFSPVFAGCEDYSRLDELILGGIKAMIGERTDSTVAALRKAVWISMKTVFVDDPRIAAKDKYQEN